MSAPALDVRRPAFVTLRVDSLEQALAAWHERLGMPVKLRGPGFAELQTDTFVLTLAERPDGPEAVLGFEVASVEEAARELEARGFQREGVAPPPAGTRAMFRMPGGVAIELIGP